MGFNSGFKGLIVTWERVEREHKYLTNLTINVDTTQNPSLFLPSFLVSILTGSPIRDHIDCGNNRPYHLHHKPSRPSLKNPVLFKVISVFNQFKYGFYPREILYYIVTIEISVFNKLGILFISFLCLILLMFSLIIID